MVYRWKPACNETPAYAGCNSVIFFKSSRVKVINSNYYSTFHFPALLLILFVFVCLVKHWHSLVKKKRTLGLRHFVVKNNILVTWYACL